MVVVSGHRPDLNAWMERARRDDVLDTVAPPADSLATILEAVAVIESTPDCHTLRPDPRLVAALVACRDYDAVRNDGSPEPIVVLPGDRPGRAKALFCLDVELVDEETER